jgi:hypothetical protein
MVRGDPVAKSVTTVTSKPPAQLEQPLGTARTVGAQEQHPASAWARDRGDMLDLAAIDGEVYPPLAPGDGRGEAGPCQAGDGADGKRLGVDEAADIEAWSRITVLARLN